MSLNKIITSVNALVNNYQPSNTNDVICIDTINNRLGIKNKSPQYELDVSGTINTNKINLYSISGNTLNINSGILQDLSISNVVFTNELSCNIIKSISSDFIELSCNIIKSISSDFIELSCNIIKSISSDTIDCSIQNNLFVGGILEISGNLKFSSDFSYDTLSISGGYLIGNNISTSSNNVRVTSDDRMKHNEIDISNALEIINKLNPQFYQKTETFKTENYRGILNEPYTYEAGFIAQEVEDISELRFTVNRGNDTLPYTLNYNNIFTYGIAAIQELDKKIEKIENTLTSPDIQNLNLSNIKGILINQMELIKNLTNRIDILENKEFNSFYYINIIIY